MSNHSTESVVRYKTLRFLGYPKHIIGSDGTIWSRAKKWKSGKWRRVKVNKWDGYLIVSLTHQGKDKTFAVHSLVLTAFVGPKPEGMLACHHPDNDPYNNRLENLRWDTPKANGQDMVKQGRSLVGERNPKVKLTEDEVREIRRLYATGNYRQVDLGKMFKVRQDTISSITRGETWGSVK